MTISKSGFFVQNVLDTLDPSQLVIDLTLATYKLALYNNTYAAATSSDFSSTTPPAYTATNEVSGTGWAAGGVLLSAASAGASSAAPTLTISPAGTMMWDMNDISVANTTLSNIYGAMFYADPITTPVADPAIAMINLGGPFNTTAGTFGIQWSALGVAALALAP